MLWLLALSLPIWAQDNAKEKYAVSMKECEEYNEEGLYQEGVESGLKTAKSAHLAHGKKSREWLRAQACLGLHLANTDQAQKAEELLLKAKTIANEILTPDDGVYAALLNALGESHWVQERYHAIEPLWKQVYDVHHELYGENASQTIDAIENLAYLYDALERPDDAIPLFVKVLKAKEEDPGDLHPDNRDLLIDLALIYEEEARYREAQPLLEKVLNIQENTFGTNHPDTLKAIARLAEFYTEHGVNESWEPMVLKLLKRQESLLGKNHSDTIRTLENLAIFYADEFRLEKAEPLLLRLLKRNERVGEQYTLKNVNTLSLLAELYIEHKRYTEAETWLLKGQLFSEKGHGKMASETLELTLTLALLYEERGHHDKAASSYSTLLTAQEKTMGKDHSETLSTLMALAQTRIRQGKLNEAEPLYLRLIEAQEKTLGKDDLNTINATNDLANLYSDLGRLDSAEPLYARVLASKERVFGKEHPQTHLTINDLGFLYAALGRYEEAEPLFKRALKYTKTEWGEEHPNTLSVVNNLGLLYLSQGRYEDAEPLLLKALESNQKTLGKESAEILSPLSNLAILYARQGLFIKAETLFERALKISKKELGKDHPNTLISINNLAGLFSAQGQYNKATPLLKKALETSERILGVQHPDTLIPMHNLAALHEKQGRHKEAETLYLKALDIQEQGYGNRLVSINALSGLYENQGQFETALHYAKRGFKLEEKKLLSRFQSQQASESDKSLFYQNTIGNSHYDILNLHLQHLPQSKEAAALALETLLRRKGRVLDAQSALFAVLYDNMTPELQAQMTAWQDTLNALTQLTLNRPKGETVESHQQRIRELEEKEREQERALAKQSAPFNKAVQAITVNSVQQKLPPNTALLEFAVYRDRIKKSAPRYAAVVLTPTGTTQWFDLGETAPIDARIQEFTHRLSSIKPYDQQAKELYQQLWLPVGDVIKNYEHVLISPDGQLNLLPFEALVQAEGQHLLETKSLSYLNSGRDLLYMTKPTSINKTKSEILVYPDYGKGKQSVKQASFFKQNRAINANRDLSNVAWTPLNGTRKEGKAIKRIWGANSRLTMKKDATEAYLKSLSSPPILHIATHGFFLTQTNNTEKASGRGMVLSGSPLLSKPTEQKRSIANPLIRSGIVLAGVEQQSSGKGEDGVMTAKEFAGMNLRGTKLVTLSACETGIGEVKNGDGVFGLRRAIAMAGAESSLMSLWKVSDDGTQYLMTAFYSRIKKKQGRRDSLRSVQLEMLTHPRYSHPFYWAAFTLNGQWGPVH